MIIYTKKQLHQMTKFDWVVDISKATAETCKKIQEEEKRLIAVGCSCGCYGVSGKLWRGETTGKMYVATNYSANIYRF